MSYRFLIGALVLGLSCSNPSENIKHTRWFDSTWTATDTGIVPVQQRSVPMSEMASFLNRSGLVRVRDMDSTIRVQLAYATDQNFLHKNLYGSFKEAYLQADVARKLVIAQMLLHTQYPQYNLLIWDAVRPRQVQRMMWAQLSDVPLKKRIHYVSNPKYGSLHNFGAAVDITICDREEHILDMGTGFDHFGIEAYPVYEDSLLRTNVLSEEQVSNRKILRKVMQEAGFTQLPTEWWHYNSCTRREAIRKYKIIE